jgi:alpha-tubulin suppressor-like RCC1 family protein
VRRLLPFVLALAGCHEDVLLIRGDGDPAPPDCLVCAEEGDCVPAADGTVCSAGVCKTGECVSTQCEDQGTWVAVAAGDSHSCVVGWAGDLWCWGRNAEGQLGLGDAEPRLEPSEIGGESDWVAVTAGSKFTCALASDFGGWCWGQNADAQTGGGDATPFEPSPRPIAGDHEWRVLDGGEKHACGVTDGGGLMCWGNDVEEPALLPAPAAGEWRRVSASAKHTCAVDRDGELSCWGANNEGQLGMGDVAPRTDPTPLPDGGSFTRVTAGWTHTCAIAASGELSCWGNNREGELGLGADETADRITSPAPVDSALEWQDVSAGEHFTCGIAADRTLWCWGHNDVGQLGLGDTLPRPSPARVGTAADWVAVAAGRHHACAVRAGGGLFCWGDNADGQLGVGYLTPREEPGETCGDID